MRLLKLFAAPSGNVVSLEDCKAQARIDHNEEDVLLEGYIKMATERAEFLLNAKLLTQTWDWFLDEFPAGDLESPLAPLVSVDSIKYYDSDNALQTWASLNYEVDLAGLVPRIVKAKDVSWPTTYDRINAVQIRVTVGYGAATAVPQAIKHWITAAVAESYKARELTREGRPETASPFIDGLLDPYRVPYVQ